MKWYGLDNSPHVNALHFTTEISPLHFLYFYYNPVSRSYFGEVDRRFPATERIINVFGKTKDRIYPLPSIREEQVINDTLEGTALAVFFKSGTVSVLDKSDISKSKNVGSVTVFNPILKGQRLIFKSKGNGTFTDDKTHSIWSNTGRCTEGVMQYKQLEPIIHGNHFAFAWFEFYPDSEIYKPGSGLKWK